MVQFVVQNSVILWYYTIYIYILLYIMVFSINYTFFWEHWFDASIKKRVEWCMGRMVS